MSRVFVLIVAVLISISLTNSQSKESTLITGDLAPDFISKTVEGKIFRLSEHRGKYVILNFWGTWCAPCIHELPNLMDVQSLYGRDSLEIVSISVESTNKDIKRFVDSVGMKWTNISEFFSNDSLRAISLLYGIESYPSNFLINKEGKIILYPVSYLKQSNGRMMQFNFQSEFIVPKLETLFGVSNNMKEYISMNRGTLFSLFEPNAKTVSLAGDFGNWHPYHMIKYEGKWYRRINLQKDSCQYKYIIDGQWVLDPANKNSVDDGKGNKNSLLIKK